MDLEQLQNDYEEGKRSKLLFFWGHTPRDPGTVDKACLSQWWPSPFEVDGVKYSTAEHYMMAEKARLFGDEEAVQRIIAAPNASDAKAIGREVRGFDQDRWEEHRVDIVVRGNTAKFSQNPTLKEYLLKTGEAVLVEASPNDRIWGIGLAEHDNSAANPLAWRGLNLLGFALMQVRSALR